MLISHRKNFIFTKTVKTAGTSIESYFEQYCMPDGEWLESHHRDEYVSDSGIIGYRGPDSSQSTWYNHMSAKTIRDLIGLDIWEHYFKFTVVRNPFDKLISGFFMFENQALNRGILINKEKTEVERFREWVQNRDVFVDRDKYLIDGQECVDFFIHFENLYEDIKYLSDRLAISFEPSRLPQFKKGIRHHRIPIQDYYDHETEQLVRHIYEWELKRFGYDLPK